MDTVETFLNILNPKQWLYTVLAGIAAVAIVVFLWVQFEQWVAAPYLEEQRLEFVMELDAERAKTALAVQALKDKNSQIEGLQKNLEAKAKIRSKENEIEVNNIRREAEILRAQLNDTSLELRIERVRNTASDSARTTGHSLTGQLGDALAKCERQVNELHKDAAESVGLVRQLTAAVKALKN